MTYAAGCGPSRSRDERERRLSVVPGLHWAAAFEAGPRGCLDGTSALIAGGLEHYREEVVRVSVPRGVLVRRATGIDVRQTRRLREADVEPSGIPRTRPHVAGVRGALWASSDKQATLVLTMVVQQRMTTAERLGAELLLVRRDHRRLLVSAVVADLLGGVRSLGEHEFARMCRERGLPEPSRQVVRQGAGGRWYLDVCWEEWGVVVEIDGTAAAPAGPPGRRGRVLRPDHGGSAQPRMCPRPCVMRSLGSDQ
jgi:hypothetical protein